MNNNNNNNFFTGYTATKFVNEYLVSRGLSEIPPQMIYNYMKKKYIVTTVVDGQNLIAFDDLNNWVEKYVARKLLK